jgi:YVTN family beta-propeller protein
MKFFITIILTVCVCICTAQPLKYTAANAHSHNDYEQQMPFHLAYNESFGSIEADIYLVGGKLLVGHDVKDLQESKTLENLYLQPLVDYRHTNRNLQLLIDVKSDAISTLDTLIALLKRYPAIAQNKRIKIVVSGNRPAENKYNDYPDFIWFDGRFDKTYSAEELNKIALLSDDFGKFTMWKKIWPLSDEIKNNIQTAIKKAHALNKPVRLWGSPDFPQAWEEMMNLEVDFINTDHINELSDYLTTYNKTLRLLPYNRIIRSAGTVVRYGNPTLENHALDIANLDTDKLTVVEDRYGIFVVDIDQKKVIDKWSFIGSSNYGRYMSTYSGIKVLHENSKTYILWTAADKDNGNSALMIAQWDGNKISNIEHIPFEKNSISKNPIPNEIAISVENSRTFLYVVLNGNNELVKIDWNEKKIIWKSTTGVAPYGLALASNKIFVSNWGGKLATDPSRERAGVPWGLAYTDPATGATAEGSLSVFDLQGKKLNEINVGLHPNVVRASTDDKYVYVANGSSDCISVINAKTERTIDSIHVGILHDNTTLQGSTPNGLVLNQDNSMLYVSNGHDNAVAVIKLGKNVSSKGKGKTAILGFIPTEAFPAGLSLLNNHIIVANLESDGANVIDQKKKARSIHNEIASVSIIPVPDEKKLDSYSQEVSQLNLLNRMDLMRLPARENQDPIPVPQRIGEPSVFKHVVYIIKENKTYDQVFGDIKTGRGDSSLCVFGKTVTPNAHALVNTFGLMDDFNASGKSSAEGHQWTDAGMVSDYIEKNVRAWYRSYPHRQEDALVYNKSGFIWNHAMDHGKTVKIYGEACTSEYDKNLKWVDLFSKYKQGIKPDWRNTSTIQRILPIISSTYPDCDNIAFSDQQRADIFIDDWKQFEKKNDLPDLLILSLPNDHTAGTSPDFPTPDAMVADNDLALGRIVETITHSKYWDSTVVFVTEDDSQGGWDHISAYRTVGMVISPYSKEGVIQSHYNQVSILRTLEQILGIPPMNMIDATSRLMIDCFQKNKRTLTYSALPNNIPLDQMNTPIHALKGRSKRFAELSRDEVFNEVDGGKDDMMNRILWEYAHKGVPYPTNSKGF